jgi:8-oxo-dGTP diphosphatase
MKQGVDFVGVCVVYFCHDGKGNVLMLKRNANTRDEHGRWDIGGGGLEFGDTVENTLRKEIKEEYCVDVIDFEFLGYRDVHRLHEGNKTHWIALDFKVLVDPTNAEIGEPHKFDELGLFPINKLPGHVHTQLPTFLEKYKNRLGSAVLV